MCTQWPEILAQCIAPMPVPSNNGDADPPPSSACARIGKYLHRIVTWFPSNIPIIGLTIANGVINIQGTKTNTNSSALAWPFFPLMCAIGCELMGNTAARKTIVFNESLEKIKSPLQKINILNSTLDVLPTLQAEEWEQQKDSTLEDVEKVRSAIFADHSIHSYISSSRSLLFCHGTPIAGLCCFGWGIGSAAGFCASSFVTEDNDANATALKVMSTVNTVLICCSVAQTVYRNYLANRLSERFESSFESIGRAKWLLESRSNQLKIQQIQFKTQQIQLQQDFNERKMQEIEFATMPSEFKMEIFG